MAYYEGMMALKLYDEICEFNYVDIIIWNAVYDQGKVHFLPEFGLIDKPRLKSNSL